MVPIEICFRGHRLMRGWKRRQFVRGAGVRFEARRSETDDFSLFGESDLAVH